MGRDVVALRIPAPSTLALILVSAIGVVSFGWPLLAQPDSALAHSADAPWLFAGLLPLLLLIVLAQLTEGRMDAKTIALLGVLAALGTGLRMLGGGGGGFEPAFFLFVVAGRALGPGFGFVLGQLTLLASALVTGGVGPWLPFQMMAAGWIALLAGLLPPLRGRAEVLMLAGYGAVAGLLYGILINLWFWPFVSFADTGISFVPGDPITSNTVRYGAFLLATSLGWDLIRAAVTAMLCLVAGPPVLSALRRAARRAKFDASVPASRQAAVANPPAHPVEE
ncbi:ECF transporter S component [Phytoactinopolyspora limicola]|uniref:ECF transporter S component n=1 Tax=Phytoactinopolyspora limicola TaxID=2715536 RepID=UPI001A9C55C8|nr:ECF transporter S component [Phytoactinopolyspora limicola]